MTVVAHGGHWISSVVMLAPLLAVAVWVGIVRFRERGWNPNVEPSSEADDMADDA